MRACVSCVRACVCVCDYREIRSHWEVESNAGWEGGGGVAEGAWAVGWGERSKLK